MHAAYPGILEIKKIPESSTAPTTFAVTFIPNSWHGGALKRLNVYGEEKLHGFLGDMIGQEPRINDIVAHLRLFPRTEIQVELSKDQLKEYRLGEVGLKDSILAYLQAL